MTDENTVAFLYLDHDVDARLAHALRRNGFNAIRAIEIGMQEATDLAQLAHAVESERIFVTHNIRDFPGIHAKWIGEGLHHPGMIVLAGYQPIAIWLQRMQNLFAAYGRGELGDQLLFLGTEFD